MMRIAAAYGIQNSHSFVTPTGIIFAIDGSSQMTKLIRISNRSTNLLKVALVNDISRKIWTDKLSASEAHRLLLRIDTDAYVYPAWLKVIAAALASSCFLIMFQGGWRDFLPVLFIGGAGFGFLTLIHRIVPIKFFLNLLPPCSLVQCPFYLSLQASDMIWTKLLSARLCHLCLACTLLLQ